MVQVSYPGVYIQEVPSGVRTITGVSTSIAAFLGRTTRGPVDQAVRVLGMADFERVFGDPHPQSELADQVRLFFLNGGSDAYVVRLARDAAAAALTLHNEAGDPVLDVTAKMAGEWGNTVRLEVDYGTATPDDTFTLRVIHESGGTVVTTETFAGLSMDPASPRYAPAYVTQSSALIDLTLAEGVPDAAGPLSDASAPINDPAASFAGFSQSRRPLGLAAAAGATLDALANDTANPRSHFEISINGSAYVDVDMAGMPVDTLTNMAGAFENRINTQLGTLTPAPSVTCAFVSSGGLNNMLRITADSGALASVRVRRAGTRDLAGPLMLGVDQGGIEPTRYSHFRPAPTGTALRLVDTSATDPNDVVAPLDSFADLAQTGLTGLTIDGTAVSLDLVTAPAGGDMYQNDPAVGVHGGNDGVREKLGLIARALSDAPALPYRAVVAGHGITLLPTSGPPTDRAATVVSAPALNLFDLSNASTAWVGNGRQYTLGSALPTPFDSAGVPGTDGLAPNAATYLGREAAQTGLHALDGVDLFNLLLLPGDDGVQQSDLDAVIGPASAYCAAQRAFLVLDPPPDWTSPTGRPAVVQDTDLAKTMRAPLVKDHAAVYYPRLVYRASDGLVKTIGPAGAVAGLMARIDSTRGVWKAPAGTEAGLRGILGLAVNLTDLENGVLNKIGVNALRSLPSGFVVWGARTLDGDDDFGSEWKYVPIRRLALFLEESLYRGTQWVVFEPNDEPLWANIRLNLNAFMMGLFRQGAFQGTTPSQAFYVKCDAETTTQADRNLGIVNIEVGFAPLKPAEFVVIKIRQIVGDL